MKNKSDDKDTFILVSENSNRKVSMQKKIPRISFNGRSDSSDYVTKKRAFGDIVEQLYSFVKNDVDYFDYVFSFFSERTVPFLPGDRDRYFYTISLQAKIKALGYNEIEVENHLKLFNQILDLNEDNFRKFRGYFLEEFMARKYIENCGIFEKVFCEQTIKPLDYEAFNGYTNNSDVDLIKIQCKSQINDRAEFDNIVQFDANEFKANTSFFFNSIYSNVLSKKSKKDKNKIIHAMEVISLTDEIFPASDNNIIFIGYRSLTDEDKKNIEKDIKTIKYRNSHSAKLNACFYKLKEKYENKKLLILGKVELMSLFYN